MRNISIKLLSPNQKLNKSTMLKLLTTDFPSSFFKQSSKCLSTSYENPYNPKYKNLLVLRNVFLWLALINIVNYCITIHYNFGRVDIVRVLSETNEYSAPLSYLATDFENILVGIYLRNEEVYSKNIEYTTIIADVFFNVNGHEVSLILEEGFHELAYFEGISTKKVESVIKGNLPLVPVLFHISKVKRVISDVLEVYLQRLYGAPKAFYWKTRITVAFILLLIFKLIILINSIFLMISYIALYYSLDTLSWHYIKLGMLYILNLVNLALCLGILITWSQLNSNKDYQLVFLVIEFILVMGFNLVLFQSHQAIMSNPVAVTYSTLSSVYSTGEEQKTSTVNKPNSSPSTGEGLTGKTVTRTFIPPNEITEQVYDQQKNTTRCFTAPIKSSVKWQ